MAGSPEFEGPDEDEGDEGLRIGPWLPEPPATAAQSSAGPAAGEAAPVHRGRHHYRLGGRHQPVPDDPDEDPPAADGDSEPAGSRAPDRTVLAVVGATIGVLVAVALILVLLPSPPPSPPAAIEPPPAAIPPPTRTATPPAPTTPAATTPPPTRRPPPAGGGRTATSRPSKPSPPPQPTRPRPRELTPQPASRERDLRSIEGERETAIVFDNTRSQRVIVYWLDYRGDRVRYRVLGAHDSYRQHTYLTHPWVVTDDDEDALVVFLPAEEPARATIR